jgi:MYXO-CTERM domain-containing protein
MSSISMRRAAAVAALVLAGQAHAVVFDLAADWSDSVNPNGTWSYGRMNGASFAPFALHVPAYINVGPSGFSAPQPAWTRCANTGNNGCPEGLAKSIGVAVPVLDFPLGKVGGHTPVGGALAVQWTAPSDGVVDITGATWMWADFQGRRLQTSLLMNGVALFGASLIPTQAQGVNSATPYSFAQAAIDSGHSASDLLGISVHSGDVFTWTAVQLPNSVEWFVGIDMTVKLTTAVPEADSFAMAALGLLVVGGAAAWRRRGK